MDQLSRLGFSGNPAVGGWGGPPAFTPGIALPRLGGPPMAGLGMPGLDAANPMLDPSMGAQQMTMMMQMMLMLLMKLMMNGGMGLLGNGADMAGLGSPAALGGSSPDASIGGGGGGGGGGYNDPGVNGGGYGGGGYGGGGGGGGGSVGSSSGGGGGGGGYSGPVPDPGPVAPGTAALLKDAGAMVGLNENRDTAQIQKVTGESGINPATTPWCAAFAINMMKDHGVLDTQGLSNPNYCPTIKSWAGEKGIWGESGKYTPKPGDAILFDWEGDGTSDHIGIVESVKDGKVYTIEGNSSDSVKRNVYDLGSSKIDGYVVSRDSTKGEDKTPDASGRPAEAKDSSPKSESKSGGSKAASPKATAPKPAAPKESASSKSSHSKPATA